MGGSFQVAVESHTDIAFPDNAVVGGGDGFGDAEADADLAFVDVAVCMDVCYLRTGGALDGELDGVEEVLFLQDVADAGVELRHDGEVLTEIAYLAHGADVQYRGRKPAVVPELDEGVQECVGGCVVGLAGIAD